RHKRGALRHRPSGRDMTGGNIHASAVLLAERGVLLRGASGSGKSALAFTLVDRARRAGGFAAWIGDARVVVSRAGGRLLAAAVPAIAGLAEAYGAGPVPVDFLPAGVIDLVV